MAFLLSFQYHQYFDSFCKNPGSNWTQEFFSSGPRFYLFPRFYLSKFQVGRGLFPDFLFQIWVFFQIWGGGDFFISILGRAEIFQVWEGHCSGLSFNFFYIFPWFGMCFFFQICFSRFESCMCFLVCFQTYCFQKKNEVWVSRLLDGNASRKFRFANLVRGGEKCGRGCGRFFEKKGNRISNNRENYSSSHPFFFKTDNFFRILQKKRKLLKRKKTPVSKKLHTIFVQIVDSEISPAIISPRCYYNSSIHNFFHVLKPAHVLAMLFIHGRSVDEIEDFVVNAEFTCFINERVTPTSACPSCLSKVVKMVKKYLMIQSPVLTKFLLSWINVFSLSLCARLARCRSISVWSSQWYVSVQRVYMSFLESDPW